MALKIRLQRTKRKKKPCYRIVVADARSPRDGKYKEKIGTYSPMLPKDSDQRVLINAERASHWLKCGAQPTERVSKFLNAFKISADAVSA